MLARLNGQREIVGKRFETQAKGEDVAAYECKLANLKVSGENIAYGSHFSIAVPDGWTVHRNVGDESAPQGPFAATPSSVSDEDMCESARILYGAVSRSDELTGILRMYATPVFRWVTGMAAAYSFETHLDNSSAISAYSTVWDAEIDFVNGACFINQLESDFLGCGLNFFIRPYAIEHGDYICCVFPAKNDEDIERARKLVCDMARTIKLDKPLVAGCEQQLINANKGRVSVRTFDEIAAAMCVIRCVDQTVFEVFVRKYEMLCKGEKVDGHEALAFAAKELALLNAKMVPYFNRLMDAYIAQSEYGAVPDDLAKMLHSLKNFEVNAFIAPDVFNDPEASLSVRASGALNDSQELRESRRRFEQLVNEEVESGVPHDPDAGVDSENNHREGIDESIDTAETTAAEGALTCDCTDYEAWWEPLPDDYEPHYIGYNDHFDHATACWALYADRVFFNDNEITWDGKHHAIEGMQINAAFVDYIPVLMEHRDDYLMGFLDLMLEVEKDEGLIVPRSCIDLAVRNALPEGDLTGITLMSLQACAHAIMISQKGAHEYLVVADVRVKSGIPDFLNLVGRLIWDMREYNGVKAPFSVTVTASRNIDANVFFGKSASLDKLVVGASGKSYVEFNRKPVVHLSSKKEADEVSHPFANDLIHKTTAWLSKSGIDVPKSLMSSRGTEEFESEDVSAIRASTVKHDKELKSHEKRIADIRERKTSLLQLEKQIAEYQDELKGCSLFDFKAKREARAKIADTQKLIEENKQLIEKANVEEEHYLDSLAKLDVDNKAIQAKESRIRDERC